MKKAKGLSPALATIILICVCVSIVVTVASLMGDLYAQQRTDPSWLPLPVDIRDVDHDLFASQGKIYLFYLNTTDNEVWWTVYADGAWTPSQIVTSE